MVPARRGGGRTPSVELALQKADSSARRGRGVVILVEVGARWNADLPNRYGPLHCSCGAVDAGRRGGPRGSAIQKGSARLGCVARSCKVKPGGAVFVFIGASPFEIEDIDRGASGGVDNALSVTTRCDSRQKTPSALLATLGQHACLLQRFRRDSRGTTARRVSRALEHTGRNISLLELEKLGGQAPLGT